MPAKKDRMILLSVLYMLAAFGTLFLVGRHRPQAVRASALALAGLFVLAYWVFFPRGPLYIIEHRAQIVPPVGEAREWRIWFAESSSDLLTQIDFPAPVKPVLPSAYPPDRPFTIRFGERGCRVEGLGMRAGVPVCFAASGASAPPLRVIPKLSAPLYDAWLRLGEKCEPKGDLAAGTEAAKLPPGGSPGRPLPPLADVFGRLAPGDVLMGWAEIQERPADDVASPDLAQSRRRPRWVLGCLK